LAALPAGAVNKYVKIYFVRLAGILSYHSISRYFSLVVSKPHYHSESFFYSISDILFSRKEQIKISKNQFESIYNIAFEKCTVCDEVHPRVFAIPFYIIMKNKSYKTKISKNISEQLDIKFNLSLFYLANLYDIIDFDANSFNSALELSYPKENQLSFKSAFSGYDDKRYDHVNQLINLCFKNNIDTKTGVFQKYKELDSYYDWLLNMEEFDYKLFDPKWIVENPTKFYFRAISKSEKTRATVQAYLKNNHNSTLERIFLNIFILRIWDK
jgi:hypothetical protein